MYNLIYLFCLSLRGLLLIDFLYIIAAFWGLWAFFFLFLFCNWNLGSRLRFDVVFMGYDLWIGLVLEFEIPIYYWLCILFVAGGILFCLYIVAWLCTTTFFSFAMSLLRVIYWFGFRIWYSNVLLIMHYYLTNIFLTFCFTNQ